MTTDGPNSNSPSEDGGANASGRQISEEQFEAAKPAINASTDPVQIWHDVQQTLYRTLGERVHKSWTAQLSLHPYPYAPHDDIALTAPSKFVASRIDGKYGDLVRQLWAKHTSQTLHIIAEAEAKARWALKPRQASGQIPSQTPPICAKDAPFAAAHLARPAAPSHSGSSRLSGNLSGNSPSNPPSNPKDRFTFNNFVIGPSNELAFAVARRVAAGQDNSTGMVSNPDYNPIVIHGPHGMGKTHLLNAVKAAALETNPSRRIHMITAEHFVASFVQSVRANGRSEIDAFKASLRDVDLLIIDDAHFIAERPGSQEELLLTLISLVDDGKQILLTCDRHPQIIEKASPRLKSYLCGGLLCDIGPADYELRVRIIDRLIEKRRESGHPTLAMPRNARDHLAARINATPRDLEGAFNQVVARSEFLGQPLTLENVQEALAQSHFVTTARPSVDKIQRSAAKAFGISMEEMLSKRRSRAIARPRQVAMYLCKTMTTRSLPDIGRRFGGRDHTTVIHAVKRIEALRSEDKTLNEQIEALCESLQQPQ